MNVAIISGGGSWGAYTVGKLKELNVNYDAVVGCSTGSLMAPLVALGEYDRLVEAYTSVTVSDIFDCNPFNRKGKVNIWKVLYRLLTGRTTIGETNALRKTIKKFFTEDDHRRIVESGKDVIITVTNLSSRVTRTEYKSIKEHSYEDFVDYMWASASIPMVGSLVKKDGKIYCDGGTTEGVPLQYVSRNYPSARVDCFIHAPLTCEEYSSQPKNALQLIVRLLDMQRQEIGFDNLSHGRRLLKKRLLTEHYLPEKPDKPYTLFDRDVMARWVAKGANI